MQSQSAVLRFSTSSDIAKMAATDMVVLFDSIVECSLWRWYPDFCWFIVVICDSLSWILMWSTNACIKTLNATEDVVLTVYLSSYPVVWAEFIYLFRCLPLAINYIILLPGIVNRQVCKFSFLTAFQEVAVIKLHLLIRSILSTCVTAFLVMHICSNNFEIMNAQINWFLMQPFVSSS